MNKGVKTIIYTVKDMARAKKTIPHAPGRRSIWGPALLYWLQGWRPGYWIGSEQPRSWNDGLLPCR